MVKLSVVTLIGAAISLTGCSTYNVGSSHDTGPNGSYAGSTMNSPVTDENPHAGGGDNSYPSSTDAGKPVATPDKLDGR